MSEHGYHGPAQDTHGYDDFAAGAAETNVSARQEWEKVQETAMSHRDQEADKSIDVGNSSVADLPQAPQGPSRAGPQPQTQTWDRIR